MRLKQLFFIATIIVITGACKDGFSSAGDGVLPGDEQISTESVAYKLDALNIKSDPIKSANPSTFILGEVADAEFGKSKAEFMTQFSIGQLGVGDTNKLKYNDNYELDSTRLLLKYPINSWIGDPSAVHKITVYELSTMLEQLETYRSDEDGSNYAYDEVVGTLNFHALNGKNDSIWSQDNYADTLFIPISEEIGNRIFEADSAYVLNNDKFRELFKGFYVTSDLVSSSNNEGSLIKFNHSSYSQELALYYKRINYDITQGTIIDTTYFTKAFPVNNESVKVNMFKHDYTDSNIKFDDNTVKELFVQPMGGSLAQLNISDKFITNWQDTLDTNKDKDITAPHLGIASTDITLYVDTVATDYRDYPVPSSLSIYRKDTRGEFITPNFINYNGVLTTGIGTGQIQYALNDRDETYPSYYKFSFSPGYFEEFILPSSYNQDFVDYRELYITPLSPESNFNRVILNNTDITSGFLSIKYVVLK